MKQYLTIRNYHEEEIGLVYRWIYDTDANLAEFNFYFPENDNWNRSIDTKDSILEIYTDNFFELKWYTEEEYKALLTMKELTS